jgi:hypothetical protein
MICMFRINLVVDIIILFFLKFFCRLFYNFSAKAKRLMCKSSWYYDNFSRSISGNMNIKKAGLILNFRKVSG